MFGGFINMHGHSGSKTSLICYIFLLVFNLRVWQLQPCPNIVLLNASSVRCWRDKCSNSKGLIYRSQNLIWLILTGKEGQENSKSLWKLGWKNWESPNWDSLLGTSLPLAVDTNTSFVPPTVLDIQTCTSVLDIRMNLLLLCCFLQGRSCECESPTSAI